MKYVFGLKGGKDNFVISPTLLINFSCQWERLKKIQKALIYRLSFSTRMGCISDVVRLCNLKTNNQLQYVKQLEELEKFGVISVTDFKQKDLEEIPVEYHTKVDSRTKTYRLTDDWILRLMLIYKPIKNNRLNYSEV